MNDAPPLRARLSFVHALAMMMMTASPGCWWFETQGSSAQYEQVLYLRPTTMTLQSVRTTRTVSSRLTAKHVLMLSKTQLSVLSVAIDSERLAMYWTLASKPSRLMT